LTDTYEIGMYNPDGELRRIIRLDIEPVPVTPSLINAWKRSRRALYGDSISRARFGRVHDAMPFPATMPAFSQLAMDTDHNLWVRNYPTHPDSTADLLVFDAYGRLRASIHLPDSLFGIVIQSDRIIGQWTDDDGVESVRIYGIRRDS
jgi:sugar lactone lactonase YvrE